MFVSRFTSACHGSITTLIEPRDLQDVHTRAHDVLDTCKTSSSLSTSTDPVQHFAIDPNASAASLLQRRRLGHVFRAADGFHTPPRLVSTCSTPSTTSLTHHELPTSRHRRCGCKDCDELLLHQIRLQTTSNDSNVLKTFLTPSPTFSTATTRQHHDANVHISTTGLSFSPKSNAAANNSRTTEDRNVRLSL